MKSARKMDRTDGLKPAPGRFTRAAAASTLSLLFGLVACNHDYTFGYVYAPSASLTSGLINAYGIDYQTGALRLLQDSPIPSGGRNTTAIAVATNQLALYVLNHDDSNVVELTIGTDGKIYPQNTYNTTGSFPTSLAVSADGKFLYVAYTFQKGFTTASPGPGGITTFAIKSDNSLSAGPTTAFPNDPAPMDLHIGRSPVAITTSSSGSYVYVVAQDAAATVPGATQTSNLFAFQSDPATGVVPLPGQSFNENNAPSFGFPSGQMPASVIEDKAGAYLYVTDQSGNAVIGYSISGGIPVQLANGTAATGSGPRGMALDPITGSHLYVANYASGTVGEYTLSNGTPSLSTTAASTAAGSHTTCVAIEPTRGIYLYASGSFSNTITGEEIVSDGSLKPIVFSPYPATTLPTCVVVVAKH